MKSINKRIKDENLDVKFIWDKPSVNGFPTKDSLLLTYVIRNTSSGTSPADFISSFDIGIALKVPSDEPIQRIGKAIAYRNLHEFKYTIESNSNTDLIATTIDYLEFIGKKLPKAYKERIKTIFLNLFVREKITNMGEI